MKKNFCPNLWYAPYIACDGNVYGCCCRQSVIFGNIYRDDLASIWNSPWAKEYRDRSLKKGLPCFQDCHIPKERLPQFLAEDRQPWAVAQARPCNPVIEFSTRCNIRCIMCRQDHGRDTSLDLVWVKKNVALGDVRDLTIQGGEFLINRKAHDFFDYLAAQKIRLILYTNGTVMDDIWAKKIARHAASIHFSINAATQQTHEKINVGSSWGKVMKNIKRVVFYRNKLKTDLNIAGHMTIVSQNIFEIPLFIRKHREIGFDSIDFSVDLASVSLFLRNHPQVASRLKVLIKKAVRHVEGIKITTDVLRVWGLY